MYSIFKYSFRWSFLGKGVGDLALASVNIVMPLTILFFGLSTMVSVGGGALVSKNFGANNDDHAIKIFRQVMKVFIISKFMSKYSMLFICRKDSNSYGSYRLFN